MIVIGQVFFNRRSPEAATLHYKMVGLSASGQTSNSELRCQAPSLITLLCLDIIKKSFFFSRILYKLNNSKETTIFYEDNRVHICWAAKEGVRSKLTDVRCLVCRKA